MEFASVDEASKLRTQSLQVSEMMKDPEEMIQRLWESKDPEALGQRVS
jgi:hypothetical protein